MDERLIHNWNERVKPEDTVYHLGDFQFKNSAGGDQGEGLSTTRKGTYWEQLNGHIVHIRGNHDNNNSRKSLLTHAVINYGGLNIGLCHDPSDFQESTQYVPIDIWMVGHVHQNWKVRWVGHQLEKMQVNVGVDVWKFYPATIEEVLKYASAMTKQNDTYQKRYEHNRKMAENYSKEDNNG